MTTQELDGTRPSFAARIDARTPASRDRLLDGLRAMAILGVILGHWLVGGYLLHADGHLSVASPLDAMPWLAPASWILQMLALFFLVGGKTAVMSYTRTIARGGSYGSWIKNRLIRLTKPVLIALAIWIPIGAGLLAIGVPAATLRAVVTVMVQPLWFIGVFIALTALTPLAIKLDQRFGFRAPIAMAAIVAVVDFLRYGPWADVVPEFVALINLLPGWLFGFQLGVLWFRLRPSPKQAVIWLSTGLALFVTLIVAFGYPASMVGGSATTRTNANPPSLLVIALAMIQIATVWLAEDRIRALLRTPRLWAGAVMLNLAAITILCWHQVAAAIPAVVATGFGGVLGLTDQPDSLSWIGLRLGWMIAFAAILAGLWFAMRWAERVRSRQPKAIEDHVSPSSLRAPQP